MRIFVRSACLLDTLFSLFQICEHVLDSVRRTHFEGRLAARIRASAREVVSACTGAVWVGCSGAKELSEGSRVVNGVFELFEINVALLGH